MKIKRFHLYKTKNDRYFYVLQTLDQKSDDDIMLDVLAIISTLPYKIFPLYSKAIDDCTDLGVPSIDLLESLSRDFYISIRGAVLPLNKIRENLSSSALSNSKTSILQFLTAFTTLPASVRAPSDVITNDNDYIDNSARISMSLNRANIITIEQAKKEILRNEEHANANNTRIAENTE